MSADGRHRAKADHEGAGHGMGQVPAPFQPVDTALPAATAPVAQLDQQPHWSWRGREVQSPSTSRCGLHRARAAAQTRESVITRRAPGRRRGPRGSRRSRQSNGSQAGDLDRFRAFLREEREPLKLRGGQPVVEPGLTDPARRRGTLATPAFLARLPAPLERSAMPIDDALQFGRVSAIGAGFVELILCKSPHSRCKRLSRESGT